jgi:hypothetical protein
LTEKLEPERREVAIIDDCPRGVIGSRSFLDWKKGRELLRCRGVISLPRLATRGSAPSETQPGRYGSEVPRTPARLVLRSRLAGSAGPHIREFGLAGFQDRLAVQPDRDPGAGTLDLDRFPLGSRPRRVGGRALGPIILRFSLDASASVLSRAVSGQQGPMPKGGIPVYPLRRVGGVPTDSFSRVIAIYAPSAGGTGHIPASSKARRSDG